VCGRFVSTSSPADLAAWFGADVGVEDPLDDDYNVAPTDDVYVVRPDGRERRVVEAYHWGLVPPWAKDAKVGSRMINARAETLATKGAFKPAFLARRCLVPAAGFYEWAEVPGVARKQPYFVHDPDGAPYAFAGLWEEWHRRGGERTDALRSTTIVTTTANDPMAALHDRMPVILPPEAWDAWLDPEEDDLDALGALLVPAPAARTALRPVSTEVNDVRHDGPHLVDEVEPLAAEPTLPGFDA